MSKDIFEIKIDPKSEFAEKLKKAIEDKKKFIKEQQHQIVKK